MKIIFIILTIMKTYAGRWPTLWFFTLTKLSKLKLSKMRVWRNRTKSEGSNATGAFPPAGFSSSSCCTTKSNASMYCACIISCSKTKMNWEKSLNFQPKNTFGFRRTAALRPGYLEHQGAGDEHEPASFAERPS